MYNFSKTFFSSKRAEAFKAELEEETRDAVLLYILSFCTR